MKKKQFYLSILIPIYNEEENIKILYEKLKLVLSGIKKNFEIIFVNDGSKDMSGERLNEIALRDQNVKVVHLRRNYGQTAAMVAGVDFASGEIIIPMDGDLQNDPMDIQRLLDKIDEGFDVVSGWRKDRKDDPVKRNFLSKVANWLISNVSGVPLHDYGCSLKAYRKDVIKDVRLYGEMHRFIPIYANWMGARLTEIPVTHYPRKFGVSKYGMNRIIKVMLDLFVVEFLHRYSTKPIYVFGGFAILNICLGLFAFIFMVYLKFFGIADFIQTPLPLTIVFTFLISILSLLMGLLAELLIRTYYESQAKTIYSVKRTKNI
ncbi:glycosyltransferase family 2 protein [Leptospira noguchii]|uniref:Glycosyltransferase, group 2 family protein n=1 Tax=Leptospira noguchii serovar Autumnalis str. ZUN142 TaxID=1085540 RepID=M6V0K7_9LEPT|nr:glycosyltransferase family 2 protein [Leptospira noguchii]EMO43068.1 glycosyltransferase, group 2 family protein [Leptospira noguchii serovar Autumnalis str. ZUN142]EMS88512.1 glycosyltransferase, group 2 family protein [Leptospira noguchii str. Hook]UOG47584.1 glycosyltransferase family 2 protein [Leptospira noguchii]